MTDQTAACRTTQHCATHGFCHRCMPSLDDATRHLVQAIDAAGITSGSGRVYAQLAATIRDAARQATAQPAAAEEQCGEWGGCILSPGHTGPHRHTPRRAEEPQDHPGAELYAQLRKAGNDHETTNRLIYAHAAMVIRQHQALHDDHAPAVGLAAPTNHTTETEQRAYDNLYAELTRGVAHAQVRHHLISEYRAAILNSAAGALDADMERFFAEWPDEPRNSPYANGRKDAANDLRRLAAGAES